MLAVHRLSKSYGLSPILHNISFALDPGERLGLIGPNGSGKTTLLRVLAGQTITVQTIANPPGRIVVSLLDMNGGSLATNADTAALSATVPATGDYQINLATASGAPAVGYTMQVFVPPAGGPVTPTRISFAPGATSGTVSGDLPFGGDLDTYVIGGGAGQVLTVTAGVAEASGWTRLFVYNAAGQLIGLGTDVTGVSAPLAAAGDYTIVIVSDPAAGPLSYTLTASIP